MRWNKNSGRKKPHSCFESHNPKPEKNRGPMQTEPDQTEPSERKSGKQKGKGEDAGAIIQK